MFSVRKIQSGLTLYDYANVLYGGFDNILTLIQFNPKLESMDVDLNSFATQELTYDTGLYQNTTTQIQLPVTPAASTIKYTLGKDQQNLYDLNLMAYSGFDSFVKFMLDNDINSANKQDLAFKNYKFDTNFNKDLSLLAIASKKGYVFISGTLNEPIVETYYRISIAGNRRISGPGNYRIYR
jgi:hypothetical protein